MAESTACIILIFVFYKLLFSSLTFFQWRRFYWLTGIGLSLIIPLVKMEVSFPATDGLIFYPIEIVGEFEDNMKEGIFPEERDTNAVKNEANFKQWALSLILTFYAGVALLLLIKLATKVFLIIRLGKNGSSKIIGGFRVIESGKVNIPYSFLNKIYLPKGQGLNPQECSFILAHEKVHVLQKHSLDIIFISLVKVFFWFNPLYKLILQEMKLLHEYIADDHVNKTGQQPGSYARLLLKLATRGPKTILVNNFSKLQIKERITMLKKQKTPPSGKMRFLLVIPLCVFLVFAFSVEKKPPREKGLGGMQKALISNGLLPDLLIEQNRKPSGWPLDNRFHRISSAFGMRLHPIDKVKKMHRGIDFPAPMGTPVYATADGVVTMVKDSPDGYGKHIRIKHGEFETLYAQLSSFEVKTGDRVLRGQIIGSVGSSGRSTNPHLHYEVLKNGKPVDPEDTFC